MRTGPAVHQGQASGYELEPRLVTAIETKLTKPSRWQLDFDSDHEVVDSYRPTSNAECGVFGCVGQCSCTPLLVALATANNLALLASNDSH